MNQNGLNYQERARTDLYVVPMPVGYLIWGAENHMYRQNELEHWPPISAGKTSSFGAFGMDRLGAEICSLSHVPDTLYMWPMCFLSCSGISAFCTRNMLGGGGTGMVSPHFSLCFGRVIQPAFPFSISF